MSHLSKWSTGWTLEAIALANQLNPITEQIGQPDKSLPTNNTCTLAQVITGSLDSFFTQKLSLFISSISAIDYSTDNQALIAIPTLI